MDWRHRASCRDEDPELFHPIGSSGPALLQIAEAKTVCRRCPVSAHCLSEALAIKDCTGVWGGMSEDERNALKRRQSRTRQRAQQPAPEPEPEEQGPRLLLIRDGEAMAAPGRGVAAAWGNKAKRHAAGVDGKSMCGTSLLDMQHALPAAMVLGRDRCGAHACRAVWRQVDEKLVGALVAAVQAAVQLAVAVEEPAAETSVSEMPVVLASVAPAVAEASPRGRWWHPLGEAGLPGCGAVTLPGTRRLARSVDRRSRCHRLECRQLWAKLDADLAVAHG
jgi:WhiB family redox-sensing transcriptional regulator